MLLIFVTNSHSSISSCTAVEVFWSNLVNQTSIKLHTVFHLGNYRLRLCITCEQLDEYNMNHNIYLIAGKCVAVSDLSVEHQREYNSHFLLSTFHIISTREKPWSHPNLKWSFDYLRWRWNKFLGIEISSSCFWYKQPIIVPTLYLFQLADRYDQRPQLKSSKK